MKIYIGSMNMTSLSTKYKKLLELCYFTIYSNRQYQNVESNMQIKNSQLTPTHSQLKEALKGFIHEVCCQTLQSD